MKTTLIISTYNRPDALEVVLKTVAAQTVAPGEIIIADDGSTDDTARLIAEWKESGRLRSPLKHVWQEDRGFRLAMIRNRALAVSTGDYIIQIDGDAPLHPRFIEDHVSWARHGSFVKGARVMLDKELSEKICRAGEMIFPSIFSGHIMANRFKRLRCSLLRNKFEHFKPGNYYSLGCNMAFWRSDAVAVNGYDEEFEGWGHEYSDFTMRLGRTGVCKRNIRFWAVQFHLWHPKSGGGQDNLSKCIEHNGLGLVRAVRGMDQYVEKADGTGFSRDML